MVGDDPAVSPQCNREVARFFLSYLKKITSLQLIIPLKTLYPPSLAHPSSFPSAFTYRLAGLIRPPRDPLSLRSSHCSFPRPSHSSQAVERSSAYPISSSQLSYLFSVTRENLAFVYRESYLPHHRLDEKDSVRYSAGEVSNQIRYAISMKLIHAENLSQLNHYHRLYLRLSFGF